MQAQNATYGSIQSLFARVVAMNSPAPAPAPSEALAARDLAVRPVTDGDAALLAAWHVAFRAAGFQGWSAEQASAFLADQHRLQQLHYARAYPDADHWLVSRAGTPVGQIHLDRTRPDWRLIDMLVAPEARGEGLGAALIAWLQETAVADAAASIDLTVAFDNAPAQALYRKAGFVEEPSEIEIALAMRWRP